MSISVDRNPDTAETTIRFRLSADAHDGPVSVVGSFNDWTPGVHPLLPEQDGTRTGSVTVAADVGEVHFRYLGSDGVWFDEPEADELTPDGSVVRLNPAERAAGEDPAANQTSVSSPPPQADPAGQQAASTGPRTKRAPGKPKA